MIPPAREASMSGQSNLPEVKHCFISNKIEAIVTITVINSGAITWLTIKRYEKPMT